MRDRTLQTAKRNIVMRLKYIGKDDWGKHTYRDEDGRYWKDEEPNQDIRSVLYSVCPNAYDGEPAHPLYKIPNSANVEITFETKRVKDHPKQIDYMLLSRLMQDCEYYLGNGGRCEDRLWGITVKDHIQKMKDLWNGFTLEEKPQWLSWEQVLEYEKQMLN